MSIQSRRFDPSALQQVLDFIQANPWKPIWPEEFRSRFLTRLISSPELVFDLHLGGQRVCIAVLLDKIQNKDGLAALEVLGLSPDADPRSLLTHAIGLSRKALPDHRTGFHLSLHESFPFLASISAETEIEPYYETFELFHDELGRKEIKGDLQLALSLPGDEVELYNVVLEAFRENMDISVPQYQEWSEGRAQYAHHSKTWLAKKDAKIVGFINLVLPTDGVAEIRTLGVLPQYRGNGLGRSLLQQAMSQVVEAGFTCCKLTVATTNKEALALYRKAGFRQVDHFHVYRWRRDAKGNAR